MPVMEWHGPPLPAFLDISGFMWMYGCVVVSRFDFRSIGRWFEAWSWLSCCFLGQETLLCPHNLSISVQVYKWVLRTKCWQ